MKRRLNAEATAALLTSLSPATTADGSPSVGSQGCGEALRTNNAGRASLPRIDGQKVSARGTPLTLGTVASMYRRTTYG